MKAYRVLLSLAFVGASALTLSGCSKGIEYEDLPESNIADKYRSIYQIMPVSYADSNGDGVGDLKGILDKVDYISSLNYTGIWLTPIHPSETYHKYDVDDYKAIDPKLGTLADYDALVSKLHEKKMTILLDLVINHSSDSISWFKKSLNAHKNHQTTNQYYNYYNIIDLQSGQSVPSGYTQSGNVAYESRFWSGMPDLNLQNVLDEPDGYLATELKDIIKFWLVDHKVDGFRLDAVTSYFTGDEARNKQFLTWLNNECKKVKPDCYIVGEGSWGSNTENQRYQESGIDSFFNFSNQSAKGYVATIVQGDASFFNYALKHNKDTANGGIEAPFVANHDTGHMIGAVKGRSSVNNLKFGHGVLSMLNGTTYTYYGDEIGLAVPSSGDNRDENKRLPMNWGDSYTPKPVTGASEYTPEDVYPYGSVADQLADEKSCVNYVKKANLLRKQLPQIARGEFKEEYCSQDETFAVVSKTYNNETIYILMNANPSNPVQYSYSALPASKPIAELCCEGCAQIINKDTKTIEIPAQGIVILK